MKTSCATVPDAADKQRADDELRMAEHCQTAYAELQALTLPESRAAPNEIAARQAYITDNCGPAKQR